MIILVHTYRCPVNLTLTNPNPNPNPNANPNLLHILESGGQSLEHVDECHCFLPSQLLVPILGREQNFERRAQAKRLR